MDEFLLQAKADGSLRLWGKVQIIEIEGVARYSLAQWLRSRRVNETIDGLSPGRQRPEYGNEYVRSVHEKDDFELMRYDHAPNTLESDEFPQDHIDPTAGPNWRLRALIRPFSEAGHLADQREERAAERLAAPAEGESRLQRAIASLAAQLAKPKAEDAPTPLPSVDDQLHELALEQDRESLIRPVEQRTRRSLNRYVADLPKGAYIDPTQ